MMIEPIPLTLREREQRLLDLEKDLEGRHYGSHAHYLAESKLWWERRWEETVLALEARVRELGDELEAQLRQQMGDEKVDECLKILRGDPSGHPYCVDCMKQATTMTSAHNPLCDCNCHRGGELPY